METIVIADTDVVIDFFSGAEPVASTIADLMQGDHLTLTSVTVFELYAGITGKKRLNQINDGFKHASFPSGEKRRCDRCTDL